MDERTEELLIGLKEALKWVLEKVAFWNGGGVVRLLGGVLSGSRKEQGRSSSETDRAIMCPAWSCRRGREKFLVNSSFHVAEDPPL